MNPGDRFLVLVLGVVGIIAGFANAGPHADVSQMEQKSYDLAMAIIGLPGIGLTAFAVLDTLTRVKREEHK